MTTLAPIGADPDRLARLVDRASEVTNLIGAVYPSTFECCERLKDLLASPDPWSALEERRAVTSVAARLHAVSSTLLGLLAEHDLVLADRDEMAAGLADRGVLIPRKRWFGPKCRK